ncbi:MAG: hypothetical protein ACOC0D_02160, partial [Spirochaeta sp.]
MGPFFGEMDLMIRQEPFHSLLADDSWSNLPGRIQWMDFNFPRRAYLAAGGDRWTLQIGRDRLRWGTSRSGSLTFSGHPEYLEFIRLSTFFRHFSYSGVFLRLEPYVKSASELPADGPYVPPYYLSTGQNPQKHYRIWRKSVVSHRFTFAPHDKLRFSLMESTGIGG